MNKATTLTATLTATALLLTGCSFSLSNSPYDLAQSEYELEASQISTSSYPDIDLTFDSGYLDAPHSESDETELLELLTASCTYAIENGATEDRGRVAEQGRLAEILFPLDYATQASKVYNEEHGTNEIFGLSYYIMGSLLLFPYTPVRATSPSGEDSFRQSAPILPCSFVTSHTRNTNLKAESNGLINRTTEDITKISDNLYQTRYPAADEDSQPTFTQWRFNNGLLESVIQGEQTQLENANPALAAKYNYGEPAAKEKERFEALLTEKVNPYIGDPEYPEWLNTEYQRGYTITDYNEADTVELIEILALSCNYSTQNGAVIKGRTYAEDSFYPTNSERSFLPAHIWEDITEVRFPEDAHLTHTSEEEDYTYIGFRIRKNDLSEITESIINFGGKIDLIAEYNKKYGKNIQAPIDTPTQIMPCSYTINSALQKLLEQPPLVPSEAIPLAVKISNNLYQIGSRENKTYSNIDITDATQIRIGANGLVESFIEFNYDFPIQPNIYYIEYGSEATDTYLGQFQQQTSNDKFETWLYNTFPFLPLW
jgi:hypothetical protein